MAKRKAPARSPARRVNPFDVPTPKGPAPSSLGSRYVPPKANPEEEALYASVAPGQRGGGRARTPEAVTQASARMNADASQISPRARAAAYREEFLPSPSQSDNVEDTFDVGDGDEPMDETEVEDQPERMTMTAFEETAFPRNPRTGTTTGAPRTAMSTPTPRRALPPPGSRPSTRQPAPPTNPGLHLRTISPTDVDRLWDWIREDGDHGATILGRSFNTSIELHAFVQRLMMAEQEGVAYIRAIAYDGTHLGFVMLSPILSGEQLAMLHTYLSPDARENADALLVEVIELAAAVVPGFHLAVPAPDKAWAAFYQKALGPSGFVAHTMFVR